ncbi:hypothetical protein PMI38_02080 [Pseudomonas sp. GM84]|jgi:hypothetical protein|uniref:hypothetical protein n=1 Tax=Pseudomonas sp. GM84 TaxID=1144340 RepID=UPI00026F5EE5|nr:hypothetical protein [Pseudomonas sp. GM84]EJN38456.1 hypothetical protein PMI38_02080 [Pseudomonas sp. GM84]
MDTNNNSTSNYAVWLPGSALILSLVVSAFALSRAPFLETRPEGGQFQPHMPIEARLWQDPFDALERYRKRVKDLKITPVPTACTVNSPPTKAQLIVALVEDGAYAETVELRRRMRYAILAGLKGARLVPEDEQHLGCLAMSIDPLRLGEARTIKTAQGKEETEVVADVEVPYEDFVADPLIPTQASDEEQPPPARVRLLWLKQDALGENPLAQLRHLKNALSDSAATDILKVIGPADSQMLRTLYREEARVRYGLGTDGEPLPEKNAKAVEIAQNIEIYSPLATADRKLLLNDFDKRNQKEIDSFKGMQLIRTVSDDTTMARLLLDELKLRHVDPAAGAQCATPKDERQCFPGAEWRNANRIALISEWDSFYSRALIESFRIKIAERPSMPPVDTYKVDPWVLRYSYLRGLDGRLPEDTIAKTDQKTEKESRTVDLSPLEKSDGNSQLDYLRRLADHILLQDQMYRNAGQSGIGAIGVLGLDTYDKLLVLQALKNRMPNKLFFSTDLDARMLQRGQAQVTRNLVLASPYGLTLTRALQQEMPPFRDSLQSAVFVSVLAALAPEPFDAKRWKFDYSKAGILSPSIYEVGISGFIPLESSSTKRRSPDCAPISNRSGQGTYIRPQDIMALRCLQDPSPPIYPEPSGAVKHLLHAILSYFLAGPLAVLLVALGLILSWWGSSNRQGRMGVSAWVPPAMYGVAALTAWVAMQSWRVEMLWVTFALILLGLVGSGLNRRAQNKDKAAAGLFDAKAWYLVVPLVIFILVLLRAYQQRESLTEEGLGEPMFLFEGISAWPTLALRLLAVIISIAALAWGARSLRLNHQQLEREFHLQGAKGEKRPGLWQQLRALTEDGKLRPMRRLFNALGLWLSHVFLPLSPTPQPEPEHNHRGPREVLYYWREHRICGSFGARLLRAILSAWIFVALTSLLFVLWPFDGSPIRGNLSLGIWSWLPSLLAFNLLVFWVVDANWLLIRFIRQLSEEHWIWPRELQREQKALYGDLDNPVDKAAHPSIDEWFGLNLIAKRTAAVSRLIYAPTIVLLILIVSRSSYFDNWPTPPGMIITFTLTGLILLFSALSLRRAAEKARTVGLQRIDQYLLEIAGNEPLSAKFRLLRERIVALNTGAFSRYADEPLVRALLLSLTGIGGSALVDALNYSKF